MKYEKYAKFEFAKNLRFLVSKIDELEKQFISAKKLDVSQRELDYIALIGANEGQPLTSIISQESISKSTFSNQVKALVAKGLVILDKFQGSEKQKTLKLTDKGSKIFKLYEDIRIHFFEKYVKPYFDESELNVVAAAVAKLLSKLNTEI